MDPVVSIIIPAYNCARFLPEALASIQQQSFTEYEVIVVDDGSTDDTRSVVKQHPCEVAYIYQNNRGVSSARNAGIAAARGKFLVFLDADDTLLPDKLHQQVALFNYQRSLSIVHSGWWVTDENHNRERLVEPWRFAPTLDLQTWLYWKPLFPAAMMFSARSVRDAGGFDESLRQAEDVDLTLRIMLSGGKAAWLRKPTAHYRQSGDSLMSNAPEQVESLRQVLDKAYAHKNLPASVQRGEQRVRYSTSVWCAWHLFCNRFLDEMERELDYARSLSTQPPGHLVLEWQTRFSGWENERAGDHRKEDPETAWPAFLRAAGVADTGQDTVLKTLQWWNTVWRSYLDNQPHLGLNALASMPELSAGQLVEITQQCLLCQPVDNACESIDLFWRDLVQAGRIPKKDHNRVTSLYLTLFAQSVFAHQWRNSARALGQAIIHTGSTSGIRAWWLFFQRATRYYMGKT